MNRAAFLPLLSLTVLLLCANGTATAATVSEIISTIDQSLTPDELAEPGNTARAKALAAMVAQPPGLQPGEVLDLRLFLAEAWLDAGRLEDAEHELTTVLTDKALSPMQRERAGLAMVATWDARLAQATEPAALPSIVGVIEKLPDLPASVQARAHISEARRDLAAKDKKVLEHLDRALVLLKESKPAARVPVYALRLLAMEALGTKSDAVLAWLRERQADPAAAEVAEQALTGNQKLVGQPAPALVAKRLDGQPGSIDIASFKGHPVLVDFTATWCKPCAAAAPGITQAVAKYTPQGLVTIGVSLDNKDSMAQIPAFIAQHGITYPIIGDGIGWDTELDDAWHVNAIPALILVDAQGKIAAVDLVGDTAEATLANIDAAMTALLPKPAEFIP